MKDQSINQNCNCKVQLREVPIKMVLVMPKFNLKYILNSVVFKWFYVSS